MKTVIRALVTEWGWAAIWYGFAAEDNKRFEQLEARVQALQQQVSTLQTMVKTLQSQLPSPMAMAVSVLDPFVSVEPGTLNGITGPHVIFSGANFHIRSGSGSTEDNTGLGNLVIGYNEDIEAGIQIDAAQRVGSHNLIIGPLHQYTASGGLVAGAHNTITGRFSSVSGGFQNTAGGIESSVSGGSQNTASGDFSSVSSGGIQNTASGDNASVSGGRLNTASGDNASVSGGIQNTAGGIESSVGGGAQNTASGIESSVDAVWGTRRAAPRRASISALIPNTLSGLGPP